MGKRKRWFWIFLFILLVALMGTLATGWNLVLIEDYRKIVNIARSVTSPNVQIPSRPWVKIVLEALDF